MLNSKSKLIRSLQSIFVAAAVAVSVVPVSYVASEPITVKAATDSVYDSLNETQKTIFRAYEYLDSRIKDADVNITSANKLEFDASGFYTMYTNADEKKKYSADDLKYARRAYVYSNPYEIGGAMAELKFVHMKSKEGKYTCYAYLKRTGDNHYDSERKALKSAVNKIMKVIDEDETNFVKEMQCFSMVIDNVTNVKVGIDNRDLKNTAYGALVTHRASSQGYALAFSILLDECEVPNDILFNANKCWNQIKIGSKWYETDLVACDKVKKGVILYDKFNISQSQMKSNGNTRINYCSNLRQSKGKRSETAKKISNYDKAELQSKYNYTLAVVNPDKTTTRTLLLPSEQTVNVVPVYINGSVYNDVSTVLKECRIDLPADSAFKPLDAKTTWNTTDHQFFTLTKGGPGANRTVTVTMVFDTDDPITVSFTATLNDSNDNTGRYVYAITGEDTATLTKCTKTNTKNINIPSTIIKDGKAYKVTKIANNAFKKCKKAETVMIGAYVTEIGKNAFSGKTKLIRVENQGFALNKFGKDAFKSADSNTIFLVKAASYGKYKKVIKKIQKAGGKNSVFKYRAF
ncbi:leucine-rich repeat protein [Butyrivibrio sp. JL13D10]|uniref:leucine-rich repeat protein n=1 Tax=Butyrivibrio sp. JL13D10 TaxID=3236815 RepID=UPI0038B53769